MALALSLPRIFSIEAGFAHLFIEAPHFSFFACLQRPYTGCPLVALSRHERGIGWSVSLGALRVEASLA